MKKLLFFFSICLVIVSCDNEAQLCDLPDDSIPAWMKSYIEESANSSISRYFYFQTANYNGQQVFVANNCCPICGTIVQIYNCQGEVIGILGSDIQLDELDGLRLFWTPADFECTN